MINKSYKIITKNKILCYATIFERWVETYDCDFYDTNGIKLADMTYSANDLNDLINAIKNDIDYPFITEESSFIEISSKEVNKIIEGDI